MRLLYTGASSGRRTFIGTYNRKRFIAIKGGELKPEVTDPQHIIELFSTGNFMPIEKNAPKEKPEAGIKAEEEPDTGVPETRGKNSISKKKK